MTTLCPVCNSKIDENASACPYCGFKLLGTTQQFRPITLEEEDSAEGGEQTRRKASLCVLRGPQNGLRFELKDRPMIVGRSPECDVFLNDMTVSRNHAEIVPFEGGYEIRDMRSFNGIWVNNTNVESQVLVPGDVIQIGTFLLLYEEE